MDGYLQKLIELKCEMVRAGASGEMEITVSEADGIKLRELAVRHLAANEVRFADPRLVGRAGFAFSGIKIRWDERRAPSAALGHLTDHRRA